MIWWIAIPWLICGFVGVGFLCANLQTKYSAIYNKQEYMDDLGMCVLFALLGPIFLVISFLWSGFGQYGWTLKYRDGK